MSKIIKFLKTWRELWILPIVITIFLLYPKLMNDSVISEAAWGAVYLQKILYALVIVFTGNLLSWFVVTVDNNFSDKLTLWQKSVLELVLFSVLYLGFILAMLSL